MAQSIRRFGSPTVTFGSINLTPYTLVETIYRTLRQKGDGTMRDTFFLDILDEYYPDAEAERQFATAVDWGRYAELFEFDADDGRLRLSPPPERFPE